MHFGRRAEKILDRCRSISGFRPGSIFAFLRWASNGRAPSGLKAVFRIAGPRNRRSFDQNLPSGHACHPAGTSMQSPPFDTARL
ncbi:DUF2840 domain-containing protein [Acetobacteraceae bacterium KSS8]|uniref:DUF2840 domain-containing protein n=1 Tax=Endosaccharibacter trunci TaxID=2812733 RepID=A0ABT1W8P8_9PROT|nr:DUF2840 domain-containing protein [Acetobacteraceae bacterium KSS8]